MSLSANLFGRDSAIFKIGNVLGLGIPGWLDKKFGPPETEGPRISDLSIQTSTYGANIPRVYATIAFAGNVIWLEGGKLREVVKKNKRGGKGGGSAEPDKTYTYFATFHLALCEGPIQGIRRIWCSDKLIYDAGSDDLETIIAGNDTAKGWTLYRGTDDQMPEPRYEADVGVDNATANRGLAYLAFRDWNLTDYGNTLEGSQFKVEVVSNQTTTAPTYYFDRSFIGYVVYTDEAVVQTAEFVSLVRVLPAVNWFDEGFSRGTMRFRTYNHKGLLLQVEVKSLDIYLEYATNESFISVFALRGAKSQLVIVNRQNSTSVGEYALPDGYEIFATGSNNQSGADRRAQYIFGETTVYTRDDGRFWIRTGNDSNDLPVSVESGGNNSSFALAYDAAAERVYTRYSVLNAQRDKASQYLSEIDKETGARLWTTEIFPDSSPPTTLLEFYCHTGRALLQIEGKAHLFDVSGQSAVLLASVPSAQSGDVFGYAPGFALVKDSNRVYRLDDVPSFSFEPLSNVLTQELALSNLIGPSDIDVASITALVKGYRVTGGSLRSSLEPLATAFQFDVIQSGYKIKFVPRGGSSVLTVPYEDLGATSSDTPDSVFSQSREMDTQLPAKTTVSYLDAAREYEVSEQSSVRINTEAVNEEDVELAIVLSADEGAGIAEILQGRAWLERTGMLLAIPPKYLALEPSDVITVDAKTATHEIVIREIEYTEDGRLEIKGVPNNAATYTPNASGGQGELPSSTIGLPGPSLFLPLDIPLVDEVSQNAPGFVGVMTGYTGGWPGATAFRSADSGQTWTDVQGYTGKASIGSATNALGVSDGYLIDSSTLNLLMISGDPESITQDQLLTGYNYAAYGVDGRWEIVRFQNAVLEADGSYTLSGFVRGDKGTEWTTGLHQPGDWFVLLDDPDNAFIGMPTDTIGLDRLYRGITQRASIETGSDIEFSYDGVNLETLSPVNAKSTRDISGNLSATFTRRSRLGSTWWGSGVVAPVGESVESYQIDVMSGAAVKRTISTATPAFSYSAADQTTDFGSAQSSILFRVYQLSETVGRGYVREVTL